MEYTPPRRAATIAQPEPRPRVQEEQPVELGTEQTYTSVGRTQFMPLPQLLFS